jgi:hypothetical protein
MSRVPWATLSERLIEDMVAVLLSQLYCEPGSGARRIDGKGGDGGRDVQIETPGGIHALEIKSFTGRMDKRRRAQVVASLDRAAALQPLDWTMLVPIDSTPGELKWFDSLRATVPFPIEWHGLTWLDAQFAARPSIARYFLENSKDELEDVARLFGQEKAALLGGAPDAMERACQVTARANELDPFYLFEITSDGTRSAIKIMPRYEGAEYDRPITASFKIAFPNDETGRKAAEEFQRAIDLGTGARIPDEYIRDLLLNARASLGGHWQGGSVELFPSEPSDGPHEARLAVLDPSDSTLAELPITLRATSRGLRGAVLNGADSTGILSVKVTSDVPDHRLSITLTTRAQPYVPDEMRRLVGFLAVLVKPNTVALRDAKGTDVGGSPIDAEEPFVEAYVPQLVDDLALVQWAARMSRKVGPDFSRDDLASLATGAALLRGVRLEMPWERMTVVVGKDALSALRRAALDGDFDCVLTTTTPHRVTIEGVLYPVGRGQRMEIVAARLEACDPAWTAQGVIPDGAEVTLVPGSTNRAFISLIT